MRIAVINSNAQIAGGIETYLDRVIPALAARGDHVALLCDYGSSAGPARIAPEVDMPVWATSAIGADRAIAAARQWRPDLVFAHGLANPAHEAALAEIAPAAFFAHDYRATCVSGLKRFGAPAERPCARRLGPGCLPRFFPRRCGGMNPLTMFADYRRAAARLSALARYRAVITASRHMRAELTHHGLAAEFYCVELPLANDDAPENVGQSNGAPPSRILFAGRMEPVKGGHLLIEAAALAAAALDRPLTLIMVGDGPERPRWERLATAATRREPRLRIIFDGWRARAEMAACFDNADVLAMPSVWPEPFGMTGLEAGTRSVPACAFALGGIPEWLEDGVNGHLAPADPPRAAALAAALVKCLADPQAYQRMRAGALTAARRYSMATHLAALDAVFARVVNAGGAGDRVRLN